MNKTIDEWLDEKIREKRIYNDAELARKAGVASSVISNARKRNSVGPDLAQKLARGLEMRQYQVFLELGLLTEKLEPLGMVSPDAVEIAHLIDSLTEEDREEMLALIKMKSKRRRKAKEKAEG